MKPRMIILADSAHGNFALVTPVTAKHSSPKVLEYEGRIYLFATRRVSKGPIIASHPEVTEQYIEVEVEHLTKEQVMEL